jgi:hypothetical protein
VTVIQDANVAEAPALPEPEVASAADARDAPRTPDPEAGEVAEASGRPISFGSLLAIAALIIAIITVPLIAHRQDQETSPKTFCKAGLYVRTIKGQEVVPQDQDPPGLDSCDLPRYGGMGALATLGHDCKIRDANGKVTGTVKPERADHSCGGTGNP